MALTHVTFAFYGYPGFTVNELVWPKLFELHRQEGGLFVRSTYLSVLTAAGGYVNSHLSQLLSTVKPISRMNEAVGCFNNEASKKNHEGK